jgi:hypothetical protein
MRTGFRYTFGPTGGLAYHYTALRFRNSLWSPFCADVKTWLLNDWLGTAETPTFLDTHAIMGSHVTRDTQPVMKPGLIVFGPSAGWTIPPQLYNQFKNLIFIEPDPLARCLLRWCFRNHKQISVEFLSEDKYFQLDNLQNLLGAYPSYYILFSNVLGQLGLSTRNEIGHSKYEMIASPLWQNGFLSALEGRQWASYHDVLSGPEQPDLNAARKYLEKLNFKQMDSTDHADIDALATATYPHGASLIDHQTLWLSGAMHSPTPQTLTTWQLVPGQYHLIALVYSNPTITQRHCL